MAMLALLLNATIIDIFLQFKNTNGSLNLHTWYSWCGYTTDDLRRDPNFPERPHVGGFNYVCIHVGLAYNRAMVIIQHYQETS
jgi:hypothetical protein